MLIGQSALQFYTGSLQFISFCIAISDVLRIIWYYLRDQITWSKWKWKSNNFLKRRQSVNRGHRSFHSMYVQCTNFKKELFFLLIFYYISIGHWPIRFYVKIYFDLSTPFSIIFLNSYSLWDEDIFVKINQHKTFILIGLFLNFPHSKDKTDFFEYFSYRFWI